MARDDPGTFVRVAANILPKHLGYRHGILDELRRLNPDELRERLAERERQRAQLAAAEQDQDTLH